MVTEAGGEGGEAKQGGEERGEEWRAEGVARKKVDVCVVVRGGGVAFCWRCLCRVGGVCVVLSVSFVVCLVL